LAAKPNVVAPSADHSPTEPLEGLVGYVLRRANGRMMADFAATFAPLAIRPVLFGILSVIRNSPGMIQMAVGNELGIQRANLVPLLNELTQRGLVERRPAPRDRRAAALFLTKEGERLFVEAEKLVKQHEEGMLRRLSASERTKLIALLGKIAAD
jgi:DNA-binding MarR family transcriptional regulator